MIPFIAQDEPYLIQMATQLCVYSKAPSTC